MSKRAPEEEIAHRRGYAAGYAAGRRSKPRPARSAPPPTVTTVVAAGFDTPDGRRITLAIPNDVTSDDLDFLEEVLPQYLALYRRRLSER